MNEENDHAFCCFLEKFDGILPFAKLNEVWFKVQNDHGHSNSAESLLGLANVYIVSLLENDCSTNEELPIVSVVDDESDLMQTSIHYFLSTFDGAIETTILQQMWDDIPDGLDAEEKIDWAFFIAAEYLDNEDHCAALSREQKDADFASNLQKEESSLIHKEKLLIQQEDEKIAAKFDLLERKKLLKTKNKAKKRRLNGINHLSSIGVLLSSSQLEIFSHISEAFYGPKYPPTLIVSVLKNCDFDIQKATEQLLSAEPFYLGAVLGNPVNVDTTDNINSNYKNTLNSTTNNNYVNNPVHNNSSLVKYPPPLYAIQNSSNISSSSCNSNINNKYSSNSSSSSNNTNSGIRPVDGKSGFQQRLVTHFINKLRQNNRGIRVSCSPINVGSIQYDGMDMNIARLTNPSDIDVSIDLHGLNIRAALDVVNSSMLYYTNNKTINNGNKDAIIVRYIVGKGIHSPGGVPRLAPAVQKCLCNEWQQVAGDTTIHYEGRIDVSIR